ncbi:MAG: tyrosine-type recombinase/integrase [Candidatus Acidiferrales bacterium]
MRKQKGYVFHRYKSWFVRYSDSIVGADGIVRRKLVCKKLKVEYGGDYRTKKSVQEFVDEILVPINAGTLNPLSTMHVRDFVERIYIPEHVTKKLRPATLKQYRDVWNNHLKSRMGNLTLRTFRTVDGESMLAQIAEKDNLGRSSLRHCKAFLSGAFKQAKRLGILDGLNPIMDVSIPRVPEPEETYAYSLSEIKSMLERIPEPASTVLLTAAWTGLRKSELRGLTWADFDGKELTVRRSVWNSTVAEPKTRRSRAPIPVVTQLADALESHKLRAGKLAQPDLPIFQAGNGKPLNLDNLARRVIIPAIETCSECLQSRANHKAMDHTFETDKALQWHGWHAFRRGLATNLHAIGIDDKTIQAILRHSNLGLTMNIYVKSVSSAQTAAMDALGDHFKSESCNDLATSRPQIIN